jgi:hypothetical protein
MAKMGSRGEQMVNAMLEAGPPLDFVEDPKFADLAINDLLDCYSGASAVGFLFVADRTTMSEPDHPVLVVDLRKKRGRSFRAAAAQIWSIQNNLSLANMDWEDFANNLDAGVFRGFARPS